MLTDIYYYYALGEKREFNRRFIINVKKSVVKFSLIFCKNL